MHRFKSAILAIFQFFQDGTFEPVHEIRNMFWPKVFFQSIMKMPIKKNIYSMPQGPPNQGFIHEKVQEAKMTVDPLPPITPPARLPEICQSAGTAQCSAKRSLSA